MHIPQVEMERNYFFYPLYEKQTQTKKANKQKVDNAAGILSAFLSFHSAVFPVISIGYESALYEL